MKNIFSINLQTNEQECDRIICRDTSDKIKEEIRLANDEFIELSKKNKKPNLLGRIQMIAFYGSFVSLLFFIDAATQKTFKVALKENWILFSLFIGLFFASIILMLIRTKLSKNIKKSEEINETAKKYDILLQHIMDDLNVPANRIDIDIYVSPYIMKGDKKVNPTGRIDFINSIFGFYSDEVNIYFANIEHVYKISKEAIKEIKKVDRSVTINRWLKDAPFKSEIYKEYNITGKRGVYSIPSVYKIVFELNGNEYYFIIPEYDFVKINDQLK